MKLRISFAIAFLLAATAHCMALTGSWRGDLNMGMAKLPLVFHFSETASGTTTATMDSPRQNATGIPLEVTFCSADSVSVECRMIGALYAGRIAGGKIDGKFMQSGYTFPLVLTPDEDVSARRPQTPRPPFPYIVKDTTFVSADGTMLAGTLTFPEASAGKRVPMVVMVSGSGPQNRDEEIFEHRPFAVIADYLARNGIASLRYDDRGTAASKGDYAKATVETFLADVKSAYEFAKGLPQAGPTGILGHSEGGTLAVMYAAEASPDFIISLAGMVVPAKETMLAQNAHSMEVNGIAGADREASMRLIELMFDEIISQTRAGVNKPIDIDALCRENSLSVPPAILESVKRSNATRNAYFNSLVSLDPTPALKRVKCPILAVGGTKDTQVDAGANLGAFSRYAGKRVEIKRMEGLNHLMQKAVTGEPAEYGEIKETISPEVLTIIADFIRRR